MLFLWYLRLKDKKRFLDYRLSNLSLIALKIMGLLVPIYSLIADCLSADYCSSGWIFISYMMVKTNFT